MKIKNEIEKNNYFNEIIKKDGAYFVVTFPSGKTEFIWVKKYENWNDDGSDWYLEHSNILLTYDITGESIEPYYVEELDEIFTPYDFCYIEGNTAYEIDSYHSGHFLPESFNIEYVTDDENEAVKYMINIEKYESLEEDKELAAMYGEEIIKSENDRSSAIEIKDVGELFDRLDGVDIDELFDETEDRNEWVINKLEINNCQAIKQRIENHTEEYRGLTLDEIAILRKQQNLLRKNINKLNEE